MSQDFSYPASFAQERLWFLEQLEPGSPVYSISAATRLQGPLDVEALRSSIGRIVGRHEALRTTFTSAKGRPMQVVRPEAAVDLPCFELETDGEGLGKAVRDWVKQQVQMPYDLEAGPLLRTSLLRLGPEEHLLVLTVHHIVFDGWSMGIFLQELSAFYNARLQGGQPRLPELPELPVQYVDYTAWQREWLQGPALERLIHYWKETLAGAPAVLELPGDRPRKAVQSFRGANCPFALPAELSARLKALCRESAVSPFMALTAAFLVLLHRYTGQKDLVIGTPVANREREEVRGLIGFFANSLVVRVGLEGDPAFRLLLQRVRQAALGAYAHQDIPFEKLVEELRPQRDLSHNPLYQAVIGLQDGVRPSLNLQGLTAEPVPADTGKALFDLSFFMEDTGDGLTGTVDYSSDLFDSATIRRMTGHFERLLEEAVSRPDQPISRLNLLTAGQIHQALLEWNPPQESKAENRTVIEMFRSWQEATPDSIAAVQQEALLSYGELGRRTDRLAGLLRRRGVVTETPVGVFVQRSLDLMTAFWGILKAGGAYLPVDPGYPPERVAFLLQDAGAPLLLAQQALQDRLPQGLQDVLLLDGDWGPLPQGGLDEPLPIGGSNLAYVIYTSGSTGQPKGVMIQHGALASYTLTASREYAICPADRVLQFCSISFDISIEEIVPCLSNGAALVLRNDQMLDSISTFLKRSAQWQLSVMSLPTAYWHEIVDRMKADRAALPPSLRLIIIAGERALPEKLSAWRERAALPPELINTYGLTESTVISTVCRLDASKAEEADLREVPIGRPIREVQLYLLDPGGQPAPAGVPGEIFVGGPLLARGYRGRASATAERFAPHPFSQRHGERLYRTGDLARQRPGGNLEFIGRMDHQVKVRGYRIELGEIETALGEHAGVEKAVVSVREDRPGQKRLVGYLVPAQSPAPSVGELRGFLAGKLPEYMVPAVFITLDQLPMTPNGKVDREALPAPQGLRPELESRYVAPGSELEQVIAAAWGEALSMEKVGRHDNFFDLGGHSLLMVQIQSRLQEELGREISILSMFQHPTVSSLAEHFSEEADSEAKQAAARQQAQQRARKQLAMKRDRFSRARRQVQR